MPKYISLYMYVYVHIHRYSFFSWKKKTNRIFFFQKISGCWLCHSVIWTIALTVSADLWLSVTLSVVLALVMGGLDENGLKDWLLVLDSCLLDMSIPETEHCRRFFLRLCGRLLRQDGGFSRSGMKALCAFLWPLWHEAAGHSSFRQAVAVRFFLPTIPVFTPSSSESEMVKVAQRSAGFRLWERCRGFGSQKSELWRLARRLCCGLLNIIQYGGQDGKCSEEEVDVCGRWWLLGPFCSPVNTQFSKLNSYCKFRKQWTCYKSVNLIKGIFVYCLYFHWLVESVDIFRLESCSFKLNCVHVLTIWC